MLLKREIELQGRIKLSLEVELTEEERREAFEEQEYLYDYMDIESKLNEKKEEGETEFYGFLIDEITEDMLEAMATEKRRQMDKYDLDWGTACEEAIKMIIQEGMELEGKAA